MKIISWNNAVNQERAELVFENRNKEYGAYQIRKDYERQVVRAFLLTIGAIILAVAIPVIIHLISNMDFSNKNVVSEEISLAEPPSIDKATPPPPPVIPPPPVVQTIKFTPPKVVKDEEVQDEPPPTQEELSTHPGMVQPPSRVPAADRNDPSPRTSRSRLSRRAEYGL